MFMMRAKIKNPWHKNLAHRYDPPNFFRPLKAKFADAKMKKTKKKVTNYGYFFAWKRLAISCKGVLSALTELAIFCFPITALGIFHALTVSVIKWDILYLFLIWGMGLESKDVVYKINV